VGDVYLFFLSSDWSLVLALHRKKKIETMPKGKGRKKAEKGEKDSNQSPNASEPIEQDSFELEVRDIDIYSVSETLSRFFNDRHDLQGTEENLCVTYETTILSQCKRYFIKHVSNKKRDELERQRL
jgi:hypothetical protein